MTNGRLVVDRVKLQKAGVDLINVIKLSKGNFTTTHGLLNTRSNSYILEASSRPIREKRKEIEHEVKLCLKV